MKSLHFTDVRPAYVGRDPKGPFLWSLGHAVRIWTLFLRPNFGRRVCAVHPELFRTTLATTSAMYGSGLQPQCRAMPPAGAIPSREPKNSLLISNPPAPRCVWLRENESIWRRRRAKREMLEKRKKGNAAMFSSKCHACKECNA